MLKHKPYTNSQASSLSDDVICVCDDVICVCHLVTQAARADVLRLCVLVLARFYFQVWCSLLVV